MNERKKTEERRLKFNVHKVLYVKEPEQSKIENESNF